MGFYSVFASFSGMLSTLWIIFLTYRITSGYVPYGFRLGLVVSIVIILTSLLFAALPFMGVASFEWTGEGFCYMDWRSPVLSSLMLVITTFAILAATTLVSLSLHKRSWPQPTDLVIILIAFVSAWILWIPSSIIGLAGGQFPTHLMLVGAIFGHAQALINPLIYGIRWRGRIVSPNEVGLEQNKLNLVEHIET